MDVIRMKKVTLAVLMVVGLCAIGMEAKPAGRGGRGGRKRKGMEDFVCALESSEGGNFNRTCDKNRECNLGPLTFSSDNVTVTLTLCNTQRTLLESACRIENVTGDVLREKRCRKQSECAVGPLDIKLKGESLKATFCTPKDNDKRLQGDRDGQDQEDDDKKPHGGRGGRGQDGQGQDDKDEKPQGGRGGRGQDGQGQDGKDEKPQGGRGGRGQGRQEQGGKDEKPQGGRGGRGQSGQE